MSNQIMNEQMKSESVEVQLPETPKVEVDPALADAVEKMRAQLRQEKKSTLIEQWIGLYATLLKQDKHIATLNEKIKVLKSKNTAEGSAVENNGDVK